jgi:hypothetical protein
LSGKAPAVAVTVGEGGSYRERWQQGKPELWREQGKAPSHRRQAGKAAAEVGTL